MKICWFISFVLDSSEKRHRAGNYGVEFRAVNDQKCGRWNTFTFLSMVVENKIFIELMEMME